MLTETPYHHTNPSKPNQPKDLYQMAHQNDVLDTILQQNGLSIQIKTSHATLYQYQQNTENKKPPIILVYPPKNAQLSKQAHTEYLSNGIQDSLSLLTLYLINQMQNSEDSNEFKEITSNQVPMPTILLPIHNHDILCGFEININSLDPSIFKQIQQSIHQYAELLKLLPGDNPLEKEKTHTLFHYLKHVGPSASLVDPKKIETILQTYLKQLNALDKKSNTKAREKLTKKTALDIYNLLPDKVRKLEFICSRAEILQKNIENTILSFSSMNDQGNRQAVLNAYTQNKHEPSTAASPNTLEKEEKDLGDSTKTSSVNSKEGTKEKTLARSEEILIKSTAKNISEQLTTYHLSRAFSKDFLPLHQLIQTAAIKFYQPNSFFNSNQADLSLPENIKSKIADEMLAGITETNTSKQGKSYLFSIPHEVQKRIQDTQDYTPFTNPFFLQCLKQVLAVHPLKLALQEPDLKPVPPKTIQQATTQTKDLSRKRAALIACFVFCTMGLLAATAMNLMFGAIGLINFAPNLMYLSAIISAGLIVGFLASHLQKNSGIKQWMGCLAAASAGVVTFALFYQHFMFTQTLMNLPFMIALLSVSSLSIVCAPLLLVLPHRYGKMDIANQMSDQHLKKDGYQKLTSSELKETANLTIKDRQTITIINSSPTNTSPGRPRLLDQDSEEYDITQKGCLVTHNAQTVNPEKTMNVAGYTRFHQQLKKGRSHSPGASRQLTYSNESLEQASETESANMSISTEKEISSQSLIMVNNE